MGYIRTDHLDLYLTLSHHISGSHGSRLGTFLDKKWTYRRLTKSWLANVAMPDKKGSNNNGVHQDWSLGPIFNTFTSHFRVPWVQIRYIFGQKMNISATYQVLTGQCGYARQKKGQITMGSIRTDHLDLYLTLSHHISGSHGSRLGKFLDKKLTYRRLSKSWLVNAP